MQAYNTYNTTDIQEDAINTYYRRRNRQKRVERRRQEKLYYIKQKIFGVVMAAFGLIIPFVTNGDATMSLLIVPMGLYTIFTKEKVFMDCEMWYNSKSGGGTMIYGLTEADLQRLDKEGIEYELTAVGDRFVYECMQKNGYVLGGEQSGHIILKKYFINFFYIFTFVFLSVYW